MSAVPIEIQIHCVERELVYRRRVYARRIEAGKMTPAQGAREIERMEAVLETLKAVQMERAPPLL